MEKRKKGKLKSDHAMDQGRGELHDSSPLRDPMGGGAERASGDWYVCVCICVYVCGSVCVPVSKGVVWSRVIPKWLCLSCFPGGKSVPTYRGRIYGS